MRSETTSPIDLDLDALAAQGAHLCRGFARGNRQVVLARGAIDATGDDLGATGEEPQQVDILQDADIALAVMHRDASLVVFGHQHEAPTIRNHPAAT